VSSQRPITAAPGFTARVRAFAEEFDYLYRVLRRHGVGPADAEDLVQDVFVVMCRRWPDYDPGRPLRPWLAGIAVRVAHDFRKRAGRELPIGTVNPADETPDAEQRLGAGRSRSVVAQALAALPPRQRELVEMADLEGLTIHEICARQAVSLFAAYARLRKAREAFARAVRRQRTIDTVSCARPRSSAMAALARE
jgi:RNA polymerase sigma-70 factor (ECF subfamily)